MKTRAMQVKFLRALPFFLVLLFSVQLDVAWGAKPAAKDLECQPAGCVGPNDLADGAVTIQKLSPDVQVLGALSCKEGQVPVLTSGVWVCGNAVVSSNLNTGFDLPFGVDEDSRNVVVLKQVFEDGSVSYDVRIRFRSNSFQISVNGELIYAPLVAMYLNVFVDWEGNLSYVSNWIEAPTTLEYLDYLVEVNHYDPETLEKNITDDTERYLDTCGSEAGGAIFICISRVIASADDSFRYFWFNRRGPQILLGEYEVNGMTFSNVRLETRRNDGYRLRAEGIGPIVDGRSGSTSNVIYYWVDGQTGGSLAYTPFGEGGRLSGLFFTH